MPFPENIYKVFINFFWSVTEWKTLKSIFLSLLIPKYNVLFKTNWYNFTHAFFCNRICIADVPILLKLSPEKVVLEMACLTYARKPICINICKEFLTTAVFFFSCAFQCCNAILSFLGAQPI